MNDEQKVLYYKCQSNIDMYSGLMSNLQKRLRGLCNNDQKATYSFDVEMIADYIAILKLLMDSIDNDDTDGIAYCRGVIIGDKRFMIEICNRYHMSAEQVLSEDDSKYVRNVGKIKVAIRKFKLSLPGMIHEPPLSPDEYEDKVRLNYLYHQKVLSIYKNLDK